MNREEIAQIIYDAFPFNGDPLHKTKPEWMPGGNSLMQDKARDAADTVIAGLSLRGREPTDEQIEIACAAYAKATSYYVEFHRGLSSTSSDEMRKGMRAALSTSPPEQPAVPICPDCGRAVDGPTHAAYCPRAPSI